MKKSIDSRYIKIILMLLFVVPAKAQNVNQNREETCNGPVFYGRELSRRATITSRPIPAMTKEALDHDVHGRVVLEAVLCRTGRVTDLRVVESLPYGMTEKVLEADRQIKFTPAEMNWQTVSERMRFEFHFNDRGLDEIAAEDAEGRIVEAIEIVGNRRLTANEIMSLIQTRPGDLCSVQQMKKDFAAILATGYFNRADTRILMEKGARAGVVVVIEVHELPLISDVKFEGLRGVAESVILEALRKDEIGVRQGGVYEPAKVKRAVRVIRNVLASNKQPDAVIEVRTEEMTATSVVLTFLISGK
ncbi:MAG: POTRA domain-containing protein [Pyrinomonadaceae bacterium]